MPAFFAYIGFDAVSVLAEESKNPQFVIEESMIIMKTTPEAPRSTTFGKRKAFESPVTSAIDGMLMSKKPEPVCALKNRSQKQDHREVANKVLNVCMPKHMSEEFDAIHEYIGSKGRRC